MNTYENISLNGLEQMYLDACSKEDLIAIKDLLTNSKLRDNINPVVVQKSLSTMNRKHFNYPPILLYIEEFLDYMKEKDDDEKTIANISELTPEKHQQLVKRYIKYGEVDKVKYLLTLPEVNNFLNNYISKENLVLQAVDFGQFEIIKLLLSSPIKEYIDIHKNEDIAFKAACKYGYSDIVNFFLDPEDFSDRPNIYKYYDDVLNIAATNGHLNTVKVLVESAGFLNEQHNIESAFKSACSKNHSEIVKYFLDSPDCNEYIREQICDPLFREACGRGHLELVKVLNSVDFLKQDATVNGVIFSLYHKQPDIARYLLDIPITKNYLSDQNTVRTFDHACANGYPDIIDKLFNFNNRQSNFLFTSLSLIRNGFLLASQADQTDVIKYLLTNQNTKKYIFEEDYQLAFNNSCFKGNINLANYLLNSPKLDKHATVNGSLQKVNEHGYNNGIIAAIKGKQIEMLQFLIFDMKARKSKSIRRYLKKHPDENAEKMFAIKEANDNLDQELTNGNQEITPKRSHKL